MTESKADAPIITIRNVWKYFGHLPALQDVSSVILGLAFLYAASQNMRYCHTCYSDIHHRALKDLKP